MIDFDKMIDNYLIRKSKPKGIGRYYPSEAGRCLRKSWYSFHYPIEVEPDLLKIFEVGNILHNFVVQVIQSEKNPDVELVKTELPVKIVQDDFLVSGRVDDVIIVKSNGRTYLVEVKSCKDLKYIENPKPDNMMQLQLYMQATRAHNGIILYIQKNDLKSRVFDVPYNENIAKNALERFKELHEYLTKNKLPPPEAKSNDEMKWMCKFCEYKERCDKE